jgi:hypothetical protein
VGRLVRPLARAVNDGRIAQLSSVGEEKDADLVDARYASLASHRND